jgi:hypothetical protein
MKSLAVVMVAFLGCSATEDVREAVGGKGDDPNPAAAAEIFVGETSVRFADANEASQLLLQPDEYLAALSPFDRTLLTATEGVVSEAEYLQVLESSARDFSAEEQTRLADVFGEVDALLAPFALSLPAEIVLVKVDDAVGHPYTRGSFIVLPSAMLGRSDDELEQIALHEIFHVLSRANPALREQLYAIVGFYACPELAYPPSLAPRKMTNPDTPVLAHCITIQSQWGPYPMIPITYAKKPFSASAGSDFKAYLEFKLLGVEIRETESVGLELGGSPWTTDPFSSQSLMSQIGVNTMYIVHPDEILADNFTYLVRGDSVQTPRILDEMAALLEL